MTVTWETPNGELPPHLEPEPGRRVPPPVPQPSGDEPRRLRSLGRTDVAEFVVSVVVGVVLALGLCMLMDWRSPMTFAAWAILGMLGAVWLLSADRLGRVAAGDRLVTALVWTSGVIAISVLAWLLAFLVVKGVGKLNTGFFTEDMSRAGPLDANGGAYHAIIGTLEQTAIATVVAVPLGILSAVYLHELKGRLAPAVRFVSDAMSGLPSIVAGLLIYTMWVVRGHGFSGAAGAASLIVIMLPIITRTAEEILRTVDPGLRESALALGSPQWRTIVGVVLPTARAGLVTASILGVARIIGETAPLLLTAFGAATTNYNPLHGQQSALSLFVYSLIRQPNSAQVQRAYAGAVALILVVLVLFVLARYISARGTKRLKGTR
jgi:phosphate transport system permease protein